MKNLITLLVGSALLTGAAAHADNKWNDDNNPSNFESNYQYNLFTLPESGTIETQNKGWSDSYWPATRGYILDRWQQPNLAFKFKDYSLPTDGQSRGMSEAQLNLLSPAEKFDIIRGRYDLPIATELKKGTPSASEWWKGQCNGWTRASLNIDEPKAIRFTSPVTGQTIPLASSDIKGLLSYYYSHIDRTNSQYVGQSCRGLRRMLDFTGACKDVNAGAFHVVISNELGIRKRGVAMDQDPSGQTWNQPYVGFESHIVSQTTNLSRGHSDEAKKEVTVSTTLTYVNELYNTDDEDEENDVHSAPQVNALGVGNQHLRKHTYQYTLELDASDRIIGGTWATGDHPDLIWRQPVNVNGLSTDTRGSSDDWTVLGEIVRQATR